MSTGQITPYESGPYDIVLSDGLEDFSLDSSFAPTLSDMLRVPELDRQRLLPLLADDIKGAVRKGGLRSGLALSVLAPALMAPQMAHAEPVVPVSGIHAPQSPVVLRDTVGKASAIEAPSSGPSTHDASVLHGLEEFVGLAPSSEQRLTRSPDPSKNASPVTAQAVAKYDQKHTDLQEVSYLDMGIDGTGGVAPGYDVSNPLSTPAAQKSVIEIEKVNLDHFTATAFEGKPYVTPDLTAQTAPVIAYNTPTTTAGNPDTSTSQPPTYAKTPTVTGKNVPRETSRDYVSDVLYPIAGNTTETTMTVDNDIVRVSAATNSQVVAVGDLQILEVTNPKKDRQQSGGSTIYAEDTKDHTHWLFTGMGYDSIPVAPGDYVKAGQVIGKVGTIVDGGSDSPTIAISHYPVQLDGNVLDHRPLVASGQFPFLVKDTSRFESAAQVAAQNSAEAYGLKLAKSYYDNLAPDVTPDSILHGGLGGLVDVFKGLLGHTQQVDPSKMPDLIPIQQIDVGNSNTQTGTGSSSGTTSPSPTAPPASGTPSGPETTPPAKDGTMTPPAAGSQAPHQNTDPGTPDQSIPPATQTPGNGSDHGQGNTGDKGQQNGGQGAQGGDTSGNGANQGGDGQGTGIDPKLKTDWHWTWKNPGNSGGGISDYLGLGAQGTGEESQGTPITPDKPVAPNPVQPGGSNGSDAGSGANAGSGSNSGSGDTSGNTGSDQGGQNAGSGDSTGENTGNSGTTGGTNGGGTSGLPDVVGNGNGNGSDKGSQSGNGNPDNTNNNGQGNGSGGTNNQNTPPQQNNPQPPAKQQPVQPVTPPDNGVNANGNAAPHQHQRSNPPAQQQYNPPQHSSRTPYQKALDFKGDGNEEKIALYTEKDFEDHGMPGVLGVATLLLESSGSPDAHNSYNYVGLFQTQGDGLGRGVNAADHNEIIAAEYSSRPVTDFYPAKHQIDDAVQWFDNPKFKPAGAGIHTKGRNKLERWAMEAQGVTYVNNPLYDQFSSKYVPMAIQLLNQAHQDYPDK